MEGNWTRYDRGEWAALSEGTASDIPSHPIVPPDEVREILLPLSDWLQGRVHSDEPFILGITGSVTVGKSTLSAALKDLISAWPQHPKVSILTTDNFLYPNRVMQERNILHRKGFPESYDREALSNVLRAFRAGERELETPVYSHEKYDIVPSESQVVSGGDVLILEGVLVGSLHDELDAIVYLDAEEDALEGWFRRRTSNLRRAALERPDLFFYQFRDMSEEELADRSSKIWQEINLINLREHIRPYRKYADLILRKDSNHRTVEVLVRREPS